MVCGFTPRTAAYGAGCDRRVTLPPEVGPPLLPAGLHESVRRRAGLGGRRQNRAVHGPSRLAAKVTNQQHRVPGNVTRSGDNGGRGAPGDDVGVTSGLPVSRGLVVPEADLRWRFSRSSGPGGQSVNTTDSRVELSLDVASWEDLTGPLRDRALDRLGPRLVDGVLTVAASEHRSQLQNRRAARARLTDALREAVAPPPRPRRPTRPSRAAQERRISAKKRRGETKRLRRSED